MTKTTLPDETRRALVRTMLFAPLALASPSLFAADTRTRFISSSVPLALTPSCVDGDEPTESQMEGPYFKPSSPERASLLQAGMKGTPLVLTGFVMTRSCKPVSRALLDFWQADDAGEYDNRGFRLRGHQFSDAKGAFRLETIVPGLYPGRTRHIHVMVQAPNRPVLTTQLYFPGEARNATDGIFDSDLLVRITDAGSRRQAQFEFILDVP